MQICNVYSFAWNSRHDDNFISECDDVIASLWDVCKTGGQARMHVFDSFSNSRNAKHKVMVLINVPDFNK